MSKRVYRESVIVFNEQEDDRVFLVKSLEEQHLVALRVLAQRFNEGDWYGNIAECEEDLSGVELLLRQLADISSADSRLTRLRESLFSSVENLNKHIQFIKDVVCAVNDRNGEKAWQLLLLRKDCEYERVALLPLEVV